VRANFLRQTLPGSASAPADRSAAQDAVQREGSEKWKDIWSAGQGVALAREVRPIAAIVDDVVREYAEAVRARAPAGGLNPLRGRYRSRAVDPIGRFNPSMPTPKPKVPVRERLSMIAQAPKVKRSVELVRKTILPPERHSRWKRMSAAALVIAGLGFVAYLGTGSAAWAVLLLVVGVPVVVLPMVLLIGMVLETRESRDR